MRYYLLHFLPGIKSSGQYKSQNNQSAASQIQRERTFFSGLRKLAGKSAVIAFVSGLCNRALRHFINSNFNCNLFLIAVFICYNNREFILAGITWIWSIRPFAIRCNSYRTMRRLFTDARDSSQRDLAVDRHFLNRSHLCGLRRWSANRSWLGRCCCWRCLWRSCYSWRTGSSRSPRWRWRYRWCRRWCTDNSRNA